MQIRGKSYNPSSIFTIRNEYNIWDSDRGGFGQRGSNDFVLSRLKMENVFLNLI